MKKLFTLFAMLAITLSSMATTFKFTSANAVSQTVDGITVTLSKASGNNDPFFSNSGEMRLYANNTITVSGTDITSISMTFTKQGSKDYATLSASTGSLVSGGTSTSTSDAKTDTWTGNAQSVTFTLGTTGQRIITELVVNGSGSGSNPSTPDPSEPETPPTLDPDYTYSEPTSVLIPSTTVQGEAYKFISNNIEVSCTKGAVTESYFSAHAGFDLTFTATQPIKGIVINGFVKKGFEATVNHGKVTFVSPSEDKEADPVVVITDVESKSVTISCVKQLRCYDVEVYFEENPEVSINGGTPGSEEDITFDSADAVYETAFVEIIGEENYSIFLYNEDEPEYPYIALDIYPSKKDDLTGTYRMSDYSLGDYTYYVYGEGEDDMSWAVDGEAIISKNGSIYSIAGHILCENNVTYNFSFKGELPIYTDDEYYGEGESDEDLTFDSAEAVYESAYVELIGEENYSIFIFNEGTPDYPYVALDIYPATKDDLTGTYSMEDYTLGEYTYYVYGEGEDDMSWAYDGEVMIEKNGEIYTIEGYIFCDNFKTYTFSFTGELPIYTDDEYYDGVTTIVVEEIPFDENAPMYNIQGQKVDKNYKGIVIQNGRKFYNR